MKTHGFMSMLRDGGSIAKTTKGPSIHHRNEVLNKEAQRETSCYDWEHESCWLWSSYRDAISPKFDWNLGMKERCSENIEKMLMLFSTTKFYCGLCTRELVLYSLFLQRINNSSSLTLLVQIHLGQCNEGWSSASWRMVLSTKP